MPDLRAVRAVIEAVEEWEATLRSPVFIVERVTLAQEAADRIIAALPAARAELDAIAPTPEPPGSAAATRESLWSLAQRVENACVHPPETCRVGEHKDMDGQVHYEVKCGPANAIRALPLPEPAAPEVARVAKVIRDEAKRIGPSADFEAGCLQLARAVLRDRGSA